MTRGEERFGSCNLVGRFTRERHPVSHELVLCGADGG